jgi:hypothetical protein
MTVPVVRMRFVRHKGLATAFINWREGVCMPFTPAHAETRTPEGTCIGEFGFGGMQERPDGYDKGQIETIADGRLADITVDLPVTQEQHDKFYAEARASLGEGYDWNAIAGFAFTGHHHTEGTAFCSAKMFLLSRAVGIIKWPVVVPAHLINPRDWMLLLSIVVEIPH